MAVSAVVSTQTVVVDTKQIFTNYSTAINLTGKINAFAILNSSNGTKITANIEHSIDGVTWTMFDDLFSDLLVPHRNKVISIPDENISKMPFIRLSFRIEDTNMISSTITINVYASQDVPGASFVHIAGAATTVIKSGAGTLSAVIVNTSGILPSTATLYDNTSGSGTVIAVIDTTSTAKLPVPLIYNLAFTTGLTVVTTGSGADLTVMFR